MPIVTCNTFINLLTRYDLFLIFTLRRRRWQLSFLPTFAILLKKKKRNRAKKAKKKKNTHPSSKNRGNNIEREYATGNHKIRHGQGHDEVIGSYLQRSIRKYANDHQDIAHDGNQNDYAEESDRYQSLPLGHGQVCTKKLWIVDLQRLVVTWNIFWKQERYVLVYENVGQKSKYLGTIWVRQMICFTKASKV